MIPHLYRAVRFSHPDLDPSEPGMHVSATGGLEMTDEHAAIRQAVLLLLSTRPGERVMRPAYGCDLHRLIFWPNDETTAGLAMHYVRVALERWEPRIELVHVDAGRDPDDGARLDIRLEYRVRSTRRTDQLVISMSLEV